VAERITTFKFRDAWIRALLADADLSDGTKIVGVRLALHLHVNSGRCNPAYLTLASGTGRYKRAAIRAIAALERGGWIKIDRGNGRGRKNDFRLLTPAERVSPELPFESDERVTPETPFHDEKKVTPETPFLTRKGDTRDQKRVTPETPSKRRRESVKGNINGPTSDFEDFWRAYPLHKAKAAAERAYQKIIRAKRATPDELIEGALRYADERRGQDPQYTKHAATWMNAGCWTDEPAAAGAALGPQLAKVVRALADMPDRDDGGTE
jgi:hypothetical protein